MSDGIKNKSAEKWDLRFLELADYIAQWSKDPSTKVGAVITDNQNRILGIGYNGFPRGVIDDPDLYNIREEKYMRVVHAEPNAILNSTGSVKGCTIYCTHFPCSTCAGIIIQSGIRKVVSYVADELFAHRFAAQHKVSEEMFTQADVYTWIYNREEVLK